ncbi:AraC family transcriptional regulator [Bradyrhizobium sp. LTSP857]|uniref:AraC family transcriptional regulator n=1 Tax=Bradyrhizobium sp. LTSP857 TaxID=1619231 RepID=UPI00067966EF|nr:AraC family transcriptional regulator [Bradyrhizobium sp. LTSP857]
MIRLTTERATRFLFSTDDLPPDDRLAIWLDDFGSHNMRLEIESRAHELLRDGNSGLAFSWFRQSGYRILGEDGATPPDAGDGILLLYAATGSFAIEGCTRLTNIRLDGALVRSKIPNIDALLLRQLPSDGVALRLLQAYVDALLATGIPADPLLAHGINHHIVDLIAASLRPGDDNSERAEAGGISAARLAAAKADIRARLADPTLSAKHVAQRLGLSERSIYLLFERNGLSFAAFVTEERLQRAVTMLVNPGDRQLRIGDIAFAAGFGDLSTFNRSFRRRYGRTPSSLRRLRSGPHEPG